MAASHSDLRPASENPWYVLMTIHGEQTGDEIDWDIHERNKETWSRFWADEINRNWSLQEGPTPAPLEPLKPEELADLAARANARGASLPQKKDAKVINLSNCDFEAHLVGLGFVFPVAVAFAKSMFQEHANFQDAKFQESADFQKVAFEENADFHKAAFQAYAYFQEAAFQGDAVFQNAVFKSDANFEGSAKPSLSAPSTKDLVLHRETARTGGAYRTHGTLSDRKGVAKEARYTFYGAVDFIGAVFWRSANFTNRRFGRPTRFEGAQFLTSPPILSGAEMHPTTTWDRVVWPRGGWTLSRMFPHRASPEQKEAEARRDRSKMLSSQLHGYAQLRLRMNEIQSHEREHQFFSRELEAKRLLLLAEGRYARSWLIGLYGLLGGYGQSITLPAVWLIVTILGGGAVLAVFREAGDKLTSTWDSVLFSATNTIAFLGVRREMFPGVLSALSEPLKVMSVGQSILGAVFLFLLLLALRNRFRIR